MDFLSFLVVNAILFIRPAEIVPEMERLPLYYFAMLACLGFGFLHLIQLVFYSPLIRHPTVMFLFGLAFFAGISLLVNNETARAIEEELDLVKALLYYTLFLAIVRTPARLQGVITCVILCMAITAALAIMHYFEFIKIAILTLQEEVLDRPQDYQEVFIRRLRFTGILHDANEVGVFSSVLIFLSGFKLMNKSAGASRLLWAIPIGIFLCALFLTQSRGGLLALLVGLTVFAIYGFQPKTDLASLVSGSRRKPPMMGFVFLALAVPVILIAFGGRQTDISTNANTAQTRFGLWSEWLQEFRYNPVVGVGPKVLSTDVNPETVGYIGDRKLLAHNSYLQPFADLGFFGGMCFLGAVGYAFMTLHRYSFGKTMILDQDLARLQPYLIAALSSYALGFFTLSLNYVLPTFFVLALPVAYYGVTPCYPPIPRPSLSFDGLVKLGLASIGFLAFTYGMIQIMPKQ